MQASAGNRLSRSPLESPTPVPVVSGAPPPAPGSTPPGDVYMAGQSHLDSSWLWRWPVTATKAQKTFGIALGEMKQFPAYTFSASQPAEYEMVEKSNPKLFAAMQQAAKEGRWNVVGGMWVEPDTNLPSGESLARQLLLGQRYFQQKFGRTATVGWLPDSFGFSANLPQLFQKAGLSSFVTTKLLWNDTTRFPYHLFWWRAPDGSKVLAYQTPDMLGRKNLGNFLSDIRSYQQNSPVKDVLLLYGKGDGGNGPQPDEVRQVQLLADLGRRGLVPPVHQAGPEAFFQHVAPKAANLPTVDGELYLQFHRGVYTTDALVKATNRRAEDALGDAEKFGVFARAAGRAYPADALTAAWKQLLLCQGHDNAAGTVVEPAAEDAHAALQHALSVGRQETDGALQAIAGRVDTRGPGQAIVVFNPLAAARDDVATVARDGLPEKFRIVDGAGRDVPLQETGDGRVAFLARGVPSLGYQTFFAVPSTAATAPAASNQVTQDDRRIVVETPDFRVAIDRTRGTLASVQDRRHGDREVLQGEGDVLEVFKDRPKLWDAWNLDAGALKKPVATLCQADAVDVVEDGPVRTVVRVHRRWHHSDFSQDIVLYHDVPRVDFQNTVDWQETHRLLKAAFPMNVRTTRCTYEVPYGTVERTTHPVTPEEKAAFEVPHQRWEDLSDPGYGVSLLNDSKYGSDVRDNVMRLSLLRSPTYPCTHFPSLVPWLTWHRPVIDRGLQHFTYSLYPHAGDWRQGGTMDAAGALNQPLMATAVDAHPGALAAEHSFASVAGDGVVLEAVKQAEDASDVVLRLFETNGQATRAQIRVDGKVVRACETNLLEQGDVPLAVKDGVVQASFAPHEIKTVRVSLA